MELVPFVCDATLAMLSSEDGALAVCRALAMGTAKNRKSAAKELRGHVLEVATHETGHMVLVQLMNVTDDTVRLRGPGACVCVTSSHTDLH